MLPDGRMYLNVHLTSRCRLLEECQTLPFSIYKCERYNDIDSSEMSEVEGRQLQQKIITRLSALIASVPELSERFDIDGWATKVVEYFSFDIFSTVRFDSDWQQNILSIRSFKERLLALLEKMNGL